MGRKKKSTPRLCELERRLRSVRRKCLSIFVISTRHQCVLGTSMSRREAMLGDGSFLRVARRRLFLIRLLVFFPREDPLPSARGKGTREGLREGLPKRQRRGHTPFPWVLVLRCTYVLLGTGTCFVLFHKRRFFFWPVL